MGKGDPGGWPQGRALINRDCNLDICKKELADVRFGSLADIEARPRHICFTPESGHRSAHFAVSLGLCSMRRA